MVVAQTNILQSKRERGMFIGSRYPANLLFRSASGQRGSLELAQRSPRQLLYSLAAISNSKSVLDSQIDSRDWASNRRIIQKCPVYRSSQEGKILATLDRPGDIYPFS
jgi:hypothetical protein